ncbi:ig-like domain-containing protein [Caerostris extrusa]|uniref:Ig-like domain-containing protein n=1 Tax=Caerostris extrusa TaxID=172846 RepID=A0AAV4XME6_CAEEX|nr:ig-like domain-containing protein [Caerostris extrusa]
MFYNSAVDHLQVNKSSTTAPKFSVQDLPAGTPFVLVIYASNEKERVIPWPLLLILPDRRGCSCFMSKLTTRRDTFGCIGHTVNDRSCRFGFVKSKEELLKVERTPRKTDVEVTLADLNNSISKHKDTSSTTFLGDVTLEENISNKKIVIKVEPPPDQTMVL